MPTKTPLAEAITRRDIVRLVAVGGSTATEGARRDRTPTIRPPAMRPSDAVPASRKSAVRLKGARDDDALPYAVVDVVTADVSNDPRHDDD